MSLVKRIGLGVTLAVENEAGDAFIEVGCIVDGMSEQASGSDINTACLGDNFDTFERGSVDPGNLDTTIAYNADSADEGTAELDSLFASGDVRTWKITFPAKGAAPAKESTFDGYLKDMGREIQKQAMITRSLSIKKSGNPGFSATTVVEASMLSVPEVPVAEAPVEQGQEG